MKQNSVKIQSIVHVTHDVLQIVTERPQKFTFIPGQATEISISKTGWRDERRPFTFTCLPSADYLEFTIKTYPSRNGVTKELLQLNKNDVLILHDVFGTISYKGEGLFIAGGAGITPFISIFRYLHSRNETGSNKLIFANKSTSDIILLQEFKKMLGRNFLNILSEEKTDEHEYGVITESFLRNHIESSSEKIYVCGPPPMMDAVEKQLSSLGINNKNITKEEF
jgi:ferredoxin-NADP reductase